MFQLVIEFGVDHILSQQDICGLADMIGRAIEGHIANTAESVHANSGGDVDPTVMRACNDIMECDVRSSETWDDISTQLKGEPQ